MTPDLCVHVSTEGKKRLIKMFSDFIYRKNNSEYHVLCYSEAAAHAVATLAEATLQGGGQIVLAETAAAVGALAGVQDATGTCPFLQLICKKMF